MRRVVLSLLALMVGCGSSALPATQNARGAASGGPLDWALLLPIETEGIVRIDLARLRRSPHRAALEPWLADLLGDVADPEMDAAFASLVDRTGVVLVATLPSGDEEDGEIVLLAQGEYEADEIERLNASSEDPSASRAMEIEGHLVWLGTAQDDQSAIVQLRPDTLALTGTIESMRGLLARTRMAPGSRRWPPALRDLVEASSLERATIGIAFANQSFGEEGIEMNMSIAGRADVDGPLDVEVLVEMGDPALAQMAAGLFSGLLEGMAASNETDSLAMRQLAERAHIEASGSRIRGSIHADRAQADQLVPTLIGLLTEDYAPEQPAVVDPSMPHTL